MVKFNYPEFGGKCFVQQSDKDQNLVAFVRLPANEYSHVPLVIPANTCPVVAIQQLQMKLLEKGGEILHFIQKAGKT